MAAFLGPRSIDGGTAALHTETPFAEPTTPIAYAVFILAGAASEPLRAFG